MNKNIKLENCKFQKSRKMFNHSNFIIHHSKEKIKKEHDILIKNWYKTNNSPDLMFYTNGSKTENEASAAIFVPHPLKYENHKILLANQEIIMDDQTKTMGKNWNLGKIFSNNIAELHAILKALIWCIKIFQNTQDFLNQEICIFSDNQNVFKFLKNVHCTGITRDIKKNIKFLVNKKFIFNFQ